MIVFQACLLSSGVAAGLLLAWLLPRIPTGGDARARNAIAFGGGAAAFISFAFSFAPPMSWVFIGTVLALYVPSLIVILGSEGPRPASPVAGAGLRPPAPPAAPPPDAPGRQEAGWAVGGLPGCEPSPWVLHPMQPIARSRSGSSRRSVSSTVQNLVSSPVART